MSGGPSNLSDRSLKCPSICAQQWHKVNQKIGTSELLPNVMFTIDCHILENSNLKMSVWFFWTNYWKIKRRRIENTLRNEKKDHSRLVLSTNTKVDLLKWRKKNIRKRSIKIIQDKGSIKKYSRHSLTNEIQNFLHYLFHATYQTLNSFPLPFHLAPVTNLRGD